MKTFLQRHAKQILGTLSGFDRLRFRGTIRRLAYADGLLWLLLYLGIRLKDFESFVLQATARLRQAVETMAQRGGRPVQYLDNPKQNKEELVDEVLQQQGVAKGGLIAVLSTVEVCSSYELYRNRTAQTLELRKKLRKCLHYYVYLQDSMFGRVNVRLQTWAPFGVHVGINGREWLAKQLDAARIKYERADNCFVWVSDFSRAQKLLDRQLRITWATHLDRLLHRANPGLATLWPNVELRPYWSVDQSEWATDIAFASAAQLQQLYPRLLQHAMAGFGSADVMRFLGRKLTAQGKVRGRFPGEVVSQLAGRAEGMRIKHRLNENQVKMYNKESSVLRVETTINQARDLMTYRPKEGDPQGAKTYRKLRKGIADLWRRAQLCQAANRRYLEALAAADTTAPLKAFTDKLCRPVLVDGRRHRALNPFGGDAELLKTVAQGEFAIKGFRNADVRSALLGADPDDSVLRRRRSSKIGRLLTLLRAHGLIKKVPHTHRYLLTDHGAACLPAIVAIRETSLNHLQPAA